MTSVYDGAGQRVQTTTSSTRNYVYDAFGALAAEYVNGSLDREYVYRGGEAMCIVEASGALKYLFTDLAGTPRMVMDGSAAIVSRHDYAPFGEDLLAGVSNRTTSQGYNQTDNVRQSYSGMEKDAATSLSHTQWRKYGNTQGRWTSVDPYSGNMSVSDPQSMNRYAYVQNDPVNFVDPSGLCPQGTIESVDALGDKQCVGVGDTTITVTAAGLDSLFGDYFLSASQGGHSDIGLFLFQSGQQQDASVGASAGAPIKQAINDPCPPEKRRFFDWLANSLGKMAQSLNTTLPLMLTQAAKEGGWTTGNLNHNQPLNNPFGVNRISNGRAVGNVNYPSLDAAIQYWQQRFGGRVQGTQSADAFINGLQHPAEGKPYNSADPKYEEKFKSIYNSMLKFMKICGIK